MKEETKNLLSIRALKIGFTSEEGYHEVVHGLDLDLKKGQIIGIVGESGSGKSVSALSILGLLPKTACVERQSIMFNDMDLKVISESKMEQIRGSRISYVFQEPMTSLNPVLTIRKQLEEVLLLHESLEPQQREEKMIAALHEVGLEEGEKLLRMYPHQLSGGMRQRVMIAMAMLCEPELLIADEITTALDVSLQAKIIELLRTLNQTHHTAILFISHDLSVIRSICDEVIVMKDGKVVEQGSVQTIYENPTNAYTKQLLAASLHLHDMKRDSFFVSSKKEPPLLKTEHYCVSYPGERKHFWGKRNPIDVVFDVNIEIMPGEIFGIVGESGCGKSTLIKAISGLLTLTKGNCFCKDTKPLMVFQDPYGSLNQAKTIGWLLEEPLRLRTDDDKKIRKQKVKQMLLEVGLSEAFIDRYPNELSGGQRQRVAIGMAMITCPKLVMLDEPVSSLDVTIQEQIIELLLELRKKYQLSYLFISHDMGVVQKLCDRVAVMYQGRVIETGTCDEIFKAPKQEYTKQLIASAGFVLQ